MSTLADLFRYLKIYRKYIGRRMYIVFVLATLGALAEGFGITLILPLLKVSQDGKSAEEMGTAERLIQDLLSWMGIAESMIGILAFIAITFAGKGLLKFIQGGYKGYLQAQLLRELKSRLFDTYSAMRYRYYIEQNTGHFINVINQQVKRFFASFGIFVSFLTQVITTVSYFGLAFAIEWKFALMALLVGAMLLFLFKYMNEYVRDLSRRLSQEMSHLNKLLVQSLQSFKYIVSTGQVDHLRSGIMSSIRRLTRYQFRQSVASAFTGAIREPISVFFIVVIIAIQAVLLQEPIAPIFVAILLFHRSMQSVVGIQRGWQNTMNRIGSVEMVADEFEAVHAQEEESGERVLDSLGRGIEFDDVCFAYNEDEGNILHDINITIPVNSTVALVGESGAGKSTILDLITLILRPRTGEVRIDGVPHDEVDLDSWRSQIGYVSQETVIFDDTIASNISLWNGDYDEGEDPRRRIQDAAQRAYADDFIRNLPNGYQTVVGDRGVRLSGGQRQRLSVARELFKNPNLLLLDEATSDLDTASEQYIQDSIDALKGEVTVVIIAHRLSTVTNADHVYVLDEGRVIEEGSYHELRAQEEGEFRKMVEMQKI